jgi:hypothetical protein
MKLMFLNVASFVVAFVSLMAAVRAVTLSGVDSEKLRRKRFWSFVQRATMTAFFTIQTALVARDSGNDFRFWMFLLFAMVGFAGMIFEYAGAIRGPRRATDTQIPISTKTAVSS